MIDYLPPILRKSEVFRELYRVQEDELNFADLKLEDLYNQLNVDTATWALSLYEEELGIRTDSEKSLTERRSIIKSMWRGRGRIGKEAIEEVINAFTGGKAEVNFDGRLKIDFNGRYGFVKSETDLFNAIDDVKPAHLGAEYKNSIYCHAEGRHFLAVGGASATMFNLTDQYDEEFEVRGLFRLGGAHSTGAMLTFDELEKNRNIQVITTEG